MFRRFTYRRFVSRLVLIPGLAAALLLTTACSSETGIVLDVSAGGLPITPDSLRFFIGVQIDDLPIDIPACGTALRFADDSVLADRVVSVAGRDLTSDPYRLLLRPGDQLPADKDLAVVVVALSGTTVVAVGSLDAPVAFIDGKVLSWDITLKDPASGMVTTTADCLCQRSGGGLVVIAPANDTDCDGDLAADDCNDNNAGVNNNAQEICFNQIDDNCNGDIDEQYDRDNDGVLNCEDCNDDNADVYPGAPEICDGVDNDCSDATPRYPETPIDCYVYDSGTCYVGQRVCNDSDELAGGWVDDCIPLGMDPQYEASSTLCDVFNECVADVDYQDGFECAGQVFTPLHCDLQIKKNTNQGIYEMCPNRVLLGEGIQLGSICRWILIGGVEQDGYSAHLRSADGIFDFGGVIESCQALFTVFETYAMVPELPSESTFDLWAEVDGTALQHLRLQVTPLIQDDPNFICPLNAMSCVIGPAP